MMTKPSTKGAGQPLADPDFDRIYDVFLERQMLLFRGQDLAPDDTEAYGWDTHNDIFESLKKHLLPRFDQAFSALLEDLDSRGLLDQTLVVCLGEFGRAPRISRIAGRDHWPEAGAAVIAGGGFQVGQAIGETDSHAGQATGRAYTPSNVLASIYRHLGIDPAITIPDHNGRPMHVLDDREPVSEL